MAKINKTYALYNARYNDECMLTLTQFINESDRNDLVDLATEDLTVAACWWVLEQHDRWSKAYITLKCLAMAQRVNRRVSWAPIYNLHDKSGLTSACGRPAGTPRIR